MVKLFDKSYIQSRLERKHKKVLKQAFEVSQSNRSVSDQLYAKAAAIKKAIEQLQLSSAKTA